MRTQATIILLCHGISLGFADTTNESVQASQRLQAETEQMRIERQRDFDAAQTKALEREIQSKPGTAPRFYPVFVMWSYGPPYYHTYNAKPYYNTNILVPGLGNHLLALEKCLPGISTNFTALQRALTNAATILERTNWSTLTNLETIWSDGVCLSQCGVPDQLSQDRTQLPDAELARRLNGFWSIERTTNAQGFSYYYSSEVRPDGLVRWRYRLFTPTGGVADFEETGAWRVQDHGLFTRVTNSTARSLDHEPEDREELISVEATTFTSRDDKGKLYLHTKRHGEAFATVWVMTNAPAARGCANDCATSG